MITCRICGRALSNPESIRLGMGPVCAKKTLQNKLELDEATVADLPFDPETMDVVCSRDESGELHFNVSQHIVMHSPTGMEWGYCGSGPADFAINILLLFVSRERAANPRLYQLFKSDFVAEIPYAGGTISGNRINLWLRAQKAL